MRNSSHLIYRTGSCAVLTIIMAIVLSSCGGDSLEATVEEMRGAACRGDVEGFLSHVDVETLIRADRRKDLAVDEDGEESPWPDGIFGKIISYVFLEMYLRDLILLPDKDDMKATKEILGSIKGAARNRLESEISKGRDSAFCRFEIQWSNDLTGVVKIDIEGRRGKDTLKFKNFLGDWKLVDLVGISISDMPTDTHVGESADPDGPASTDVSAPGGRYAAAEESPRSPPPGEPRPGKESVASDHSVDTIYKPGYDFRKTRWGMTPEEVKASEDSESGLTFGAEDSDSYIIYYDGAAGGIEATYIYHFTYGELSKGAYYFKTKGSDPAAYLDNFEEIKTKLAAKYGKPAFDKIVLGDEYYEGKPEDALTALASGEATYAAGWNTRSTTIDLQLFDDEGMLTLALLYKANESVQLSEP